MSGSVVDLNLIPDRSIASAAALDGLLVPKIEPKSEPFDQPELLRASLSEQPRTTDEAQVSSFSNNAPGSSHNPQFAPPTPTPTPDPDALADFHRASDRFRAAFAAAEAEAAAADTPLDDDVDGDGDADAAPAPAPAPAPATTDEIQNPLAIVPAEDPQAKAVAAAAPPEDGSRQQLASSRIASYRKYRRSAELVRVMDLGADDAAYYRDQVRRTLMIYNGLRILSGRIRGNFTAAAMMRTNGLWINRDKRIVGAIPGIHVGDVFFYRMELCVIGLHGQTQAGIDYVSARETSNGQPIATSVIVSGGYEDDEDAGDVITYTGHGGQDKFNHQCANQKLEGGNLALERSMHYGIEIRVIRGIKYYSPGQHMVYVYDGLYRITDCWLDSGRSGFGVFKYRLERIEGQPEMGSMMLKLAKCIKTRPLETRPAGYLSMDLSKGAENVPVFLFNDLDRENDPMFYEYLAKTVFPPFVHQQSRTGTGCECECETGCGQDCFCIAKNGGTFPYDTVGLLVRGKPVIFECGPHCKCPPYCRNRVAQRGMKVRLEIFRSRATGWAVRSLDLIQAGEFVCDYTGVVLTREQAQIVSMNGDGLVYPNRFAPKWEEWGDLSKVFPELECPVFPSIPPLDFAMDVSKMRNVACYISHSQRPNLMVQYVLYDHSNIAFPHSMLFALENIPPMTELSLDYGVPDDWTGKPVPLLCH